MSLEVYYLQGFYNMLAEVCVCVFAVIKHRTLFMPYH